MNDNMTISIPEQFGYNDSAGICPHCGGTLTLFTSAEHSENLKRDILVSAQCRCLRCGAAGPIIEEPGNNRRSVPVPGWKIIEAAVRGASL